MEVVYAAGKIRCGTLAQWPLHRSDSATIPAIPVECIFGEVFPALYAMAVLRL